MELLKEHILYALIVSALISASLEVVKERLQKWLGVELSGVKWFIISILVSGVTGFGYTIYYEHLPLDQSIAIMVIVVLGVQVFYKVIFDHKDEVIVLEEVNETPKNVIETMKKDGEL